MKRVLAIIGFVAVVIFLIVLIWYFFFRPLPPVPPETPPEEPITVLPVPGERVPLRPQPVTPPLPEDRFPQTAQEAQGGRVQTHEIEPGYNIHPRVSPDGESLVTFDLFEGAFSRIAPDGSVQRIGDQRFPGATTVTFSPQNDKAIIEFLDDRNIVYDIEGQRQIATLPNHWESFHFSPNGDALVFKSIADNPENNWFATANIDGSGGQLIEQMGKKAVYFTPLWSPSDQIIGFFEEGVDANQKRLYFIGKNDEKFQAIIVEGRDIRAQWSPLGTQLLYSAYSSLSGFRPELWVVDALGTTIGENRRKLDVQTWSDKCGFADNTTLYCATPKEIPEGGGLIPTIAEEKSGGEVIYKIDLETGEKRKVAEPRPDVVAQNVQINKNQTLLFFTDKYTGKLYRIQLE